MKNTLNCYRPPGERSRNARIYPEVRAALISMEAGMGAAFGLLGYDAAKIVELEMSSNKTVNKIMNTVQHLVGNIYDSNEQVMIVGLEAAAVVQGAIVGILIWRLYYNAHLKKIVSVEAHNE